MGGIFIAFGGALHFSVGPSCRELAASNPGLVKILTGKSSESASLQIRSHAQLLSHVKHNLLRSAVRHVWSVATMCCCTYVLLMQGSTLVKMQLCKAEAVMHSYRHL